jgi:hypothetical protein
VPGARTFMGISPALGSVTLPVETRFINSPVTEGRWLVGFTLFCPAGAPKNICRRKVVIDLVDSSRALFSQLSHA